MKDSLKVDEIYVYNVMLEKREKSPTTYLQDVGKLTRISIPILYV